MDTSDVLRLDLFSLNQWSKYNDLDPPVCSVVTFWWFFFSGSYLLFQDRCGFGCCGYPRRLASCHHNLSGPWWALLPTSLPLTSRHSHSVLLPSFLPLIFWHSHSVLLPMSLLLIFRHSHSVLLPMSLPLIFWYSHSNVRSIDLKTSTFKSTHITAL